MVRSPLVASKLVGIVVAIGLTVSSCAKAPPPEEARSGKEVARAADGEVPVPDCAIRVNSTEHPALRYIDKLQATQPAQPTADMAKTRRYATSPDEAKPFPGVAYAAVRGFAYRLTERPTIPILDDAVNGCSAGCPVAGSCGQVISEQGELCPSVLLSGSTLADQQINELLKLLRAQPAHKNAMCGFNPHHAIVFYNAQDEPVSDVRIDFRCGRWSLRGAPPVRFPDGTRDAPNQKVRLALESLCSELGLEDCPRAKIKNPTPSSGVRVASQILELDKATRLSELTPQDRRRLCAVRLLEHQAPGRGFEFASGVAFRFQTFAQCVQQFPVCESTLGELEAVDLRLSELNFLAPVKCIESWLSKPEARCLWGVTLQ